MRCLVTGAAGLLGSWLTDYLIEHNHEVYALDNLQEGKKEYVNVEAEFCLADLRDKEKVDQFVRHSKPEAIYNLSAWAAEGQSVFNPTYTVESNIIGFLNLFTSALNVGFETFVFTSSMSVYGEQTLNPDEFSGGGKGHPFVKDIGDSALGFSENQPRQPVDPYGITKASVERFLEIYAEEFNFQYVIIRPYNIYGPHQSLTNPYRNVFGIWFNRMLHEKPPVIYGDGEQTRAFGYVKDITPYIAESAWNKKAHGEIFNMGSDEVHTLNEACQIAMSVMNFGSKAPHPSLRQPIYAPARPLEVKHAFCSSDKAKRVLGYKTTTTLKDGLSKMAEWAKQIGPQFFNYWSKFEINKKVPKVWGERQL